MTSNTEIILELEMYMQRYRDALGEIANCGDQANALYLREIAQTALDGEPTTADKFNKEVQNYGPLYSMTNPSGELVKDSTLGAGFAHKDVKWVSPHDPGDENKNWDVVSSQEKE